MTSLGQAILAQFGIWRLERNAPLDKIDNAKRLRNHYAKNVLFQMGQSIPLLGTGISAYLLNKTSQRRVEWDLRRIESLYDDSIALKVRGNGRLTPSEVERILTKMDSPPEMNSNGQLHIKVILDDFESIQNDETLKNRLKGYAENMKALKKGTEILESWKLGRSLATQAFIQAVIDEHSSVE